MSIERGTVATAAITSPGHTTLPKSDSTALRLECIETDAGFLFRPATRNICALKGPLPKPRRPVTVAAMKRAQLKTFQFVGRCVRAEEIPSLMVEYVANRLGVEGGACLMSADSTRHRHRTAVFKGAMARRSVRLDG